PPSQYRRRLPAALEAIVLRAMEKDPSKRYPSPADMLADLRAFSRQLPAVEEEIALDGDEEFIWTAVDRMREAGYYFADRESRRDGESLRAEERTLEGTRVSEEDEQPTRIVSAEDRDFSATQTWQAPSDRPVRRRR